MHCLIKKYSVFVAGTFLCLTVSAQQLPHFTQFYLNRFMLNPAMAGTEDHYDIRTNNRYQWTGITDAPRTFSLSGHGPTKSKKIGLGAFVYTDNVGPSRRTGFQGSYAYHLKINEVTNLSFGLSFGAQEFAVDASKIQLKDPNDNAFLVSGVQKDVNFDASFGTLIVGKYYFVGFTVPQLFSNQLTFFNDQDQTLSQLENHFLMMAGYEFNLNPFLSFEPVVLVKYVSPIPPMVDINGRIIYKNDHWIGVSYRTSQDISLMVGLNYQDNFSFGYAYDFAVSNLANYSNGTHEVMIGLRFIREKVNSVRKTEEKNF